MKGNLRRVIDGYTRLQKLETALASAESHDELWCVLVNGSREFGFTGIQITYMGESRESEVDSSPDHTWQLKVDLPHSQHVQFTRSFTINSPGSNIIVEFIRLIETSLSTRYFAHCRAAESGRAQLSVYEMTPLEATES